MADLEGKTIAATYRSVLNVGTSSNQELDATPRLVEDGAGNDSALWLATGSVALGIDDTGADFRVYSATTNEGLFYDASEDEFGLLLTTKLKFHDIGGGEEMYASGNGVLLLNSGTSLTITTPTLDLTSSTKVDFDSPILDMVTQGTTIELKQQVDALAFDGNADNILNINALNNRVGIGTAAPGALLEIKGADVAFDTNVVAQLNILDTAAFGAYPAAGIAFQGYTTGTTAFTMGGIYIIKANTTENNESAKMRLLTRKEGSNPAIAMTIDEDQHVGIGTDSPASLLTTSADTTNEFTMYSAHDNLSSSPYISMYKARGDIDCPTVVLDNTLLGQINWFAYDSDSYLQGAVIRAIVNDAGTPGDNNVATDLEFFTNNGASAVTLNFRIAETGDIYPGTDGTQDLGSASLQFEGVWLSDGAIDGSDERIKENIEDSVLGLDFVNRLRPVSFKKKDREVVFQTIDAEGENATRTETKTYKRTHYGLIAQEVKGVLDDLSINTEKFAGYVDGNFDGTADKLFLRYTEFIAPMMKAIQELSAKVTALENA